MNVLLGVTGSVAAKLTHKLESKLLSDGHKVECIVTNSAKNFVDSIVDVSYQDDRDEWYNTSTVLHIDLVKWADIFLIAPCTANTLAKISNGICDNLITNCARAWDLNNKKMFIAPAMNVMMWNHPSTKQHIKTLESWGIKIIPPQIKKLYCGDTGIGAMAEIDDILIQLYESQSPFIS